MRTLVLVLAAAAVAGAAVVSGQSPRGAATLDDVVTEVRALRADLKQSTRAGTEMQLLTARLSLQEQRIAVLSNQRNDVSSRLAVEKSLR